MPIIVSNKNGGAGGGSNNNVVASKKQNIIQKIEGVVGGVSEDLSSSVIPGLVNIYKTVSKPFYSFSNNIEKGIQNLGSQYSQGVNEYQTYMKDIGRQPTELGSAFFGVGNILAKDVAPTVFAVGNSLPSVIITNKGASLGTVTEQVNKLTDITNNIYSSTSTKQKIEDLGLIGANLLSDFGVGYSLGLNPVSSIAFPTVGVGAQYLINSLENKPTTSKEIEGTVSGSLALAGAFNVGSEILGAGASAVSKISDVFATKYGSFALNTITEATAFTGAQTGVNYLSGNPETPSQILVNEGKNIVLFGALNFALPAIESVGGRFIGNLRGNLDEAINGIPFNKVTDEDFDKVINIRTTEGELPFYLNTNPNMGTSYTQEDLFRDYESPNIGVNVGDIELKKGMITPSLEDIGQSNFIGGVRSQTPGIIEPATYFQTATKINGEYIPTADIYYQLGSGGESLIGNENPFSLGTKYINIVRDISDEDITYFPYKGYDEITAVKNYNEGQLEYDKPFQPAYQNMQRGGSETQFVAKVGTEITDVEHIGNIETISAKNSFYNDIPIIGKPLSDLFPKVDYFKINDVEYGGVVYPNLVSIGEIGEPETIYNDVKSSSKFSTSSLFSSAIPSLSSLFKSSSKNLSKSTSLPSPSEILKSSMSKSSSSKTTSSISGSGSARLSYNNISSINSSKSYSFSSGSSNSYNSGGSSSGSSSGGSSSYPPKRKKEISPILFPKLNEIIAEQNELPSMYKAKYGRMANIFGAEEFKSVKVKSKKQLNDILKSPSETLIRPVLIYKFKRKNNNINGMLK